MHTLHFSFDDIAHTLHDLCVNRYDSVFQQPFLGRLRAIHQATGAVFTLFCFNRLAEIPGYDIANLPDCYQAELSAESHWLRFGFHAEESPTKYAVDTGAGEAIVRCKEALRRFAGEGSIDSILRLGFFSGSLENVLAVKKAGVRGLYAADDTRLSYHLNQEQNDEVIRTGRFDDPQTGMVLIRSLPRLDNRSAEELIAAMDGWPQPMTEVFMHEKTFLHEPENYQRSLTSIARWASEQGYVHKFHSDVLFEA